LREKEREIIGERERGFWLITKKIEKGRGFL